MIRIFTTIYAEERPARAAEYEECLRRNAERGWIDEIRLLMQGKDVRVPSLPKLHIRAIGTRPLYADYFSWINDVAGPDDISIVANTDIWFDDSVAVAARVLRAGQCFALARWERDGLFDRNDSQDCWMFRGPVADVRGDFPVGVPRCDNRMLHELHVAGYTVRNPAFSVKCHHVHAGIRAEYLDGPNDVPGPYRYLWPHNLFGAWRSLLHNVRHPGQRVAYRLDRRRLSRWIVARAYRAIRERLLGRTTLRARPS